MQYFHNFGLYPLGNIFVDTKQCYFYITEPASIILGCFVCENSAVFTVRRIS